MKEIKKYNKMIEAFECDARNIVETNKDDVPEWALKTIILDIIRYATDNHIDGIEFEEVVNDLIEYKYMTEDELEKIDRGVYNDWLEWKEENVEQE